MSEMSDFNEKQQAYLDWLALSKFERKPMTEQLLADELGVTDRTLRRWKKLPGFREAITKRAREIVSDDLPEIYGALRREAIKGSFQHIKIALEIAGEHTDKVDITWRRKLPQGRDPDEVINQFRELLYLAAKRERINKPGDN